MRLYCEASSSLQEAEAAMLTGAVCRFAPQYESSHRDVADTVRDHVARLQRWAQARFALAVERATADAPHDDRRAIERRVAAAWYAS